MQTALTAAVDRCLRGSNYYFPYVQSSVEGNQQVSQQFWLERIQDCANDPRLYTPQFRGPEPTASGAAQRRMAADAIDSAPNGLQASIISGEYYEYPWLDKDQEHPGYYHNNEYSEGESSDER